MAKFNPNDIDKVIHTVDKYTREALKIIGKDPTVQPTISQTRDVRQTTSYNVPANGPAGVMESLGRLGGMGSIATPVPSSLKDIPEAHLVTILDTIDDKVQTPIYAALQDKVTFLTESKWESFNELDAGRGVDTQIINAVAQVFRQSLSTRFASRRMWKSTSPVSITLQLKFESVENSWRDVVEPCLRLNKLALPTDGTLGIGSVKILNPPGPSPFTVGNNKFRGEWIDIQVGKYLLFKTVVVETVSVTFNKKLDTDGLPISADVAITFQTYEVITKQTLEEFYKVKTT
jgi:hypothetical protein